MWQSEGLGPIAARDRIALMDSEVLRWRRPDIYGAWASGALRPWRVQMERERLSAGPVPDMLDVPAPSLDLWERGYLYPSWIQFCRFSALIDRSPEELLVLPSGMAGDPRVTEDTAPSQILRRQYDREIVNLVVSTEPEGPALDAYLRVLEEVFQRAEQRVADLFHQP